MSDGTEFHAVGPTTCGLTTEIACFPSLVRVGGVSADERSPCRIHDVAVVFTKMAIVLKRALSGNLKPVGRKIVCGKCCQVLATKMLSRRFVLYQSTIHLVYSVLKVQKIVEDELTKVTYYLKVR